MAERAEKTPQMGEGAKEYLTSHVAPKGAHQSSVVCFAEAVGEPFGVEVGEGPSRTNCLRST